MGVKVTVLAKSLRRKLSKAKRKAMNLRPVMEEIGEIIKVSVRRNFDESGRPTQWEPLKYRQGKPLMDTARLVNSIQAKVSARSVTVQTGSNVIYAATHQYGRGAIPARPYMMLQDEDMDDISEAIGDFLAGDFN